MNYIKNLTKPVFVALIAMAFIFSACEDETNAPQSETLVDVLQDNGYSVLGAALTATGLNNTLAQGTYTVFAPSDAAFAAAGLDASNIAQVPNLESILLYHVVAGEVRSSDLRTGGVETANGKFLNIDATNLTVNGISIASPFDVDADNGVVHTIDGVLLPQFNIVETASADPNLSILVDALGMFPDIVTALGDESANYTVFAPTNDAFVALLGVVGQTSLDDVPESVIENILFHHVLTSPVRSTDLSDGLTATTLSNEDITVTQSGSDFLISGAGIGAADVETSNGVVHVVNGVLVPPTILTFVNTIVEPAYFNKNFTTLIAAVQGASPAILETLLGAGPNGNGMTLFAPTNAAFEAANILTLPDQATLDAVLTYHLIDGVVEAAGLPVTDVASPATISTVGGDFFLSNKGGGVFINGNSQVEITDIDPSEGAGTANGVVHVINRTLVPPSQDIVDIAVGAGFGKLAEALTEANLVNTLKGAGPFTVFAPTDAAFDALYSALGVSGPAEIDDALLEDVLLYHVIGAKAFSSDLVDGLDAATLSDANGTSTNFVVNFVNDGVTITDGAQEGANITQTNILGTNGVIHVIDKVILPN